MFKPPAGILALASSAAFSVVVLWFLVKLAIKTDTTHDMKHKVCKTSFLRLGSLTLTLILIQNTY